MNKRSIILLSGAFLTAAAWAAPLTPEQALARLNADGPKRISAKRVITASPVFTAKSEAGAVGAYVFNTTGGGYMIVSADDIAAPLLGYSDAGSIDPQNLSPELKWWLGEYARQIEWAVKNGREAQRATRASGEDFAPIAPLVKSKWDQDAPYNDLCPIPLKVNGQNYTGGEHAFSGCVATSMAQLMYYHKYPEVGVGTIAYTPTRQGYTYDRQTWNLARHPFEWDMMLDVYTKGEYTEEQGLAVANLMKSCGFSVQMSYGLDASGAAGMDIANALRTYFNYDQNCRSEYRDIYSFDQWEKILYDNLANVGPLVVNGQSPSDGGHSFICDGYDGNGYFHFNWGWSGMSDGYYLLEALNPSAQGIGGYEGGFNFSQTAIVGARKPQGDNTGYNTPVRVFQHGALTAKVNGKNLDFGISSGYTQGFGNSSDRVMNVNVGAIFEKVDDSQWQTTAKGSMTNGSAVINVISLSPNMYYKADQMWPRVEIPTLSDGEYKVYLASYDNECQVKEWVPVACRWGYPNYIYLTVSGGQYTVKDATVDSLKINSVEIESDLYYGRYFKIKASITNNSNIQLTGYYAPALYNGTKRCFYGESIGISVNPGETIEYEWLTKFNADSGAATSGEQTLKLGLFNPSPEARGDVYGYFGNATIKAAPAGNLRLSIGDFIVSGEKTTVEYDGRDMTTVLVSDPSKVEVSLDYRVVLGYFDGQMKLALFKKTEGSQVLYPVIDEIAIDQPLLSAGTNGQIKGTFAVPDPEAGVLYTVQASYTNGSRWQSFGTTGFMTGVSGIDEISAELNSEAEYYNLQGVKVDNPCKGETLIMKKGNITKKVIF